MTSSTPSSIIQTIAFDLARLRPCLRQMEEDVPSVPVNSNLRRRLAFEAGFYSGCIRFLMGEITSEDIKYLSESNGPVNLMIGKIPKEKLSKFCADLQCIQNKYLRNRLVYRRQSLRTLRNMPLLLKKYDIIFLPLEDDMKDLGLALGFFWATTHKELIVWWDEIFNLVEKNDWTTVCSRITETCDRILSVCGAWDMSMSVKDEIQHVSTMFAMLNLAVPY